MLDDVHSYLLVIYSDMADVTAAATNIDSQDFIDDLYSYDNTAKNAWKYGVKRKWADTTP